MTVPNFSFLLARLELAEKFGVVWCRFQVTTVSNLNPNRIELELGLVFDNFDLI